MARRRRRKSKRFTPLLGLFIIAGTAFLFRDTWWPGAPDTESTLSGTPAPALTTTRPETDPLDGGPNADVIERGADPLARSPSARPAGDAQRAAGLMSAARRALAEGDRVLARAHFSEALNTGLNPQDEQEARAELRKLGKQTIFSSEVFKGDPFTGRYVIAPGDTLNKIAKAYDVTAEFLADINNITDMHRIRAGRRIKVVRGPFQVRVTRSTYTLDVYCGDTFVDHFKVGLGAEDSTPTGKWVVATKLKNPTYYPPRGGNIIAADDPANPLGERWIGLAGIEGEAVGQSRYGMHGTIDPDSIGKNASMGCIRMHNEDVAFLYTLLIEKKSTVEVRD